MKKRRISAGLIIMYALAAFLLTQTRFGKNVFAISGTSHTGGICRVSGVLCGILILGVINNGLVMLKVDDNMTNIVKGIIIIGSVVLDMRKNAKKN